MVGRIGEFVYKGAGWIIAICIIAVIVGCSGTEVGNPDTEPILPSDSNIQTMNNDAELEIYLKEQHAKSVNVGGLDGIQEDSGGSPPNPTDNATTPSSDKYSDTNIQEEGVDESDMVKTDGAYFYVADGRSFHVVDISGAMEVITTQSVDGYINALYLYDNKLVVLYEAAQPDVGPWDDVVMPTGNRLFGACYWIPVDRKLGVVVFDITYPRKPEKSKAVEFDGYLISSRRIGGKLHIVQQFRPQLPPLDYWHDGTAEDKEEKISANQQAIDSMTLDQLIPSYHVISGPVESSQTEGPTVSSKDYYCPVDRDGGGTITTITSFDLDDDTLPFKSVAMVADGHIVYASTKALYIANHKYYFEAPTSTSEEATIYKFDLTGESVQFAGDGVVPGWILNQFSLGEYQDVLRVATTSGHAGGWGETSKNNVYCLQLNDKTLEIIGKIENLAPGEQIYAARFMGKRGYLVTYVKVDPLFTLNLSRPKVPEVAGYLKVPGYSDYIHPYGDDYLITVGKDAKLVEEDNMAWYQGVQLSLFNIKNFSEPEREHNIIIGDRGTNTEASHNHKAFTFWAEHNLLALPVNLYKHQSPPAHASTFGTQTFSGLYVYRVSPENGFDYLGRISTEHDPASPSYRYGTPWTRGIFVDQQVFTVTPDAVRSALIDNIEEGVQTVYLND